MMTPALLDEILAHAASEVPREACGLLVATNIGPKYFRCRNTHPKPTDNFAMDRYDQADAEDAGEILALVHSHPSLPPNPSQADKVEAEKWGLPWFIVNPLTGEMAKYEPNGYVAPLVGREFVHGILDCFTLIRDFYSQELGITLPDFEREDDWWHKGQNLYTDHYAEAGFVVTHDDPRRGDVILMQLRSDRPNHGAVFLGDETILHHLPGRLSRRDPYCGYWHNITTHVLRYERHVDRDCSVGPDGEEVRQNSHEGP